MSIQFYKSCNIGIGKPISGLNIIFWSSPDTIFGDKENWPDKIIFPSDTDISVMVKYASEPTL